MDDDDYFQDEDDYDTNAQLYVSSLSLSHSHFSIYFILFQCNEVVVVVN